MSDIVKTIGQRLRGYRQQLGWSQEKVADLADVHPTYVGQVERGEKNATLETVEKLANAMQVPLSRLFENLGNQPSGGRNIPAECYEFMMAQSKEEQERLYRILLEIAR